MRSSTISFCALVSSLLSFVGTALAAPAHPQRLADLPLPAQATIAAALGRDQPAYHATRQGAGFRVSNPRHAFTAGLTSTGLHLRQGGATARLHLTGWGYGRPSQPLPRTAPQATANRIEYRRGALTEWYINGPLGLEQGMTLSRPPRPRRAGPLTLAMRLDGDLTLQVDEARTAAAWHTRAGVPVLRYTGLTVTDATGATLPAWLTTDGSRLLIQVDEARARYPLTIDPFIQQAKLIASDGEFGDEFGGSVAISGDGKTIVVGVPYAEVGDHFDQGVAYVFSVTHTSGIPSVTQAAKLSDSFGVFPGSSFDRFGTSVAISGDGTIIVVGAPRFDWAMADDGGIAYIFITDDASGWTDRIASDDVLVPFSSDQGGAFGTSVAISGDGTIIVVGAPKTKIGNNLFQGAAYVFYKPSKTSFAERRVAGASDGAAGDSFGSSVASSSDGKTIVVGAADADVGDHVDQGAAYVFSVGIVTNELFLVSEVAKLTASDGAAGDSFGSSVASSSDTVVVGAPYADIGSNADQGQAYVFAKPMTGWENMTETAELLASDGLKGDFFGSSVAISGDTLVVGAPFASSLPGFGSFNDGAAYVFAKPMTGWTAMTETGEFFAADGQGFDLFGSSVAISGDTVVVGASGVSGFRGAAYVFRHVPRLTVNIDGSGSVAGPRIVCPTDCSEDYDVGALVTLTPTAERDWEFDHWSGDPDCADGVLTMNADRQCTAHFVRARPDLIGGVWDALSQSCRKDRCTLKGSLTVWNQGTAKASASRLRVFLSADPGLDASDLAAAKDKSVKSIKPKLGKKIAIKWTLPAGVNGAGMYLVGLIDSANEVQESNEANNTLISGSIP